MSKPRQTTLFQSWGNKKQEPKSADQHAQPSTSGQTGPRLPKAYGSSAGLIDLCDDEGEDAMLARALEASLKDVPPGFVEPQEHSTTAHQPGSSSKQERNKVETPSNSTAFTSCHAPADQKSAWGSLFKTVGSKSKVDAGSMPKGLGSAMAYNEDIPDMSSPMTQEVEELPLPDVSGIPDIPGFDKLAGRMWIYPTNYSVRAYQFSIVHEALFQNTLVVLPTGLGKTFIAAVVMYNFYRWYPQGKIVFMAPTKPLVAQQIEACYNIMGIPQDDTAEMTGAMQPAERKKSWRLRRIFFLTPQVLTNDLSRGALPACDVKCLVVDEAHKALGNHAYCQVVRELFQYNHEFRVLALSATPGSDIKAVQQVLTNLLISHIELRTEESADIRPFTHERRVDKIVVPLGQELSKAKEQYLRIIGVVVMRLRRQGVLYNREPKSLSKFLILKAREAFRQDPPPSLPPAQFGVVEGDFALCMSLYHGYDLIQQHGLRSLFNYLDSLVSGEKGTGRTRTELLRNHDFTELMDSLASKFKPIKNANPNMQMSQMCSQAGNLLDVGHPKMEKLREIVLEHFNKFKDETGAVNTRIMIFSQFRDSVNEITEMLNRHRPLVKAMSFIGQSSAGKSTKGFTQKEQLKVMSQFREGGYNTLVSTCVGEEGLDIGDVDLIVCFDAHKSPIRLVQRMGRTGRKREGRIVMLVSEGKEEQIYNQSQYSKRSIHRAIQNGTKSLVLFAQNARMVPAGLDPVCHRMHITVKSKFEAISKTRSTAVEKNKNKSMAITKPKGAGKKKCDGFLTEEELEYWSKNFKTDDAVPMIPESTYHSHILNPSRVKEIRKPEAPLLSLSEWTPWQNRLQRTKFVGHSLMSQHLVELMEFIDVQGAVGDDEDNYGMEMQAFLNEEDVMKSGHQAEGILRYCTPNPALENKDKKRKRQSKSDEESDLKKAKKPRRSDLLPVFSSDEEKNSDDELPKFCLKQTNDSNKLSTASIMTMGTSKEINSDVNHATCSSDDERPQSGNGRIMKAKEPKKNTKGKNKKNFLKPKNKLKGLPDLPAFDASSSEAGTLLGMHVHVKHKKKKKGKSCAVNDSVIKPLVESDADDFIELDDSKDKTDRIDLDVQAEEEEKMCGDEDDTVEANQQIASENMFEEANSGQNISPDDIDDDPELSQLFPVFSPCKSFISSQPGDFDLKSGRKNISNTCMSPQKDCKNKKVQSPPSLEELSAAMASLDKKGRLSPVDILDLINIWHGSSQETGSQTLCKSSKTAAVGLSEKSPVKFSEPRNGFKMSVPEMNIRVGHQWNDPKQTSPNRRSTCVVKQKMDIVSESGGGEKAYENEMDSELFADDFSPELDNVNEPVDIELPFQVYSKGSSNDVLLGSSKKDSCSPLTMDKPCDGLNVKKQTSAGVGQFCTPGKSAPHHARTDRLSLLPSNTSTPLMPGAKSVFSQSAAHSSFFEDSHDDLMLEACQTPALLNDTRCKTASASAHETSQVTFTQALALVHQSMDSSKLMNSSKLVEKSNSDSSDKQDSTLDLLSETDNTNLSDGTTHGDHQGVDSKKTISKCGNPAGIDVQAVPSPKAKQSSPTYAPVAIVSKVNESSLTVLEQDAIETKLEPEEPQFDLGFDFDDLDDDFIIPPSPPSTQQFSQLSLASNRSTLRHPSPALYVNKSKFEPKTVSPKSGGVEEKVDSPKKCDTDVGNMQDFADVFEDDFSMEMSHTDSNEERTSPSLLLPANGKGIRNQTVKTSPNKPDSSFEENNHTAHAPNIVRFSDKRANNSPAVQFTADNVRVTHGTSHMGIEPLKASPPVAVVAPRLSQESRGMVGDVEDVATFLDGKDWEGDIAVSASAHKDNSDSGADSDDSFIHVKQRKRRPAVLTSPDTPEPSNRVYSANKASVDSSQTFKTPLKIPSFTRRKTNKVTLISDHEEEESPLVRRGMRRKVVGQQRISFDSDEDDDFVEHRKPVVTKKSNVGMESIRERKSSCGSRAASLAQKKKKKRGLGANFLEIEAEISGDEADHYSSGEENSDQDLMEASFINDATQASQHESVDMRAIYMRSVRSPGLQSGIKLSYENQDMDVFSQIAEQDTEYMEDSFCVGDDHEDTELQEDDSLYGFINDEEEDSFVECAPKKKSTTRRQIGAATKQNRACSKGQLGGRRRVVQIMDSSSDEEQDSRNMSRITDKTMHRSGDDPSFVQARKKSCAKISSSSDSDTINSNAESSILPASNKSHKVSSKVQNIGWQNSVHGGNYLNDHGQICDNRPKILSKSFDNPATVANSLILQRESPISQLPSLRSRLQKRLEHNILPSSSVAGKVSSSKVEVDIPDFDMDLNILDDDDDDFSIQEATNETKQDLSSLNVLTNKKSTSFANDGQSVIDDGCGKFTGKSNQYGNSGHINQSLSKVRVSMSLAGDGMIELPTGNGGQNDAAKARDERLRLSRLKQEECRRRLASKTNVSLSSTTSAQTGLFAKQPVYNGSSVQGNKSHVGSTLPSPISKHHNSGELLILVDSREINGAQDILSALRFKHKLRTAVRQLTACDYILSSRMAVDRKNVSDFSNGSNRAKLVDQIRHMCELYDRPCLIVERDRIKGADGKPNKTLIRTKYVDTVVASIAQMHIKVFYTDTQVESAEILAELAQQEDQKKMGLHMSVDLTSGQEQVLSFYLSLPRVSYATALLLLQAFPTIKAFLHSPAAVIQKRAVMTRERAELIHSYLHHRFDAQMVASKR